MKKVRILLLSMLIVLSMAFFTGCGVEDPTVADVEKALKDEGYIPDGDEEEKEDEDDGSASASDDSDSEDDAERKDAEKKYSVAIDKCKINDDKDKATVDATLTVTDEYLETKSEFEIVFKLRDDKTWRCKSVELEDSDSALKAGIPDDKAVELTEDWYFSVSNGEIYVSGDDIKSVKAGKHETDLEDLKDVVTMTVSAVDGLMEVEFDVEMTFECSLYEEGASWYVSDEKVNEDSLKVEYVESYTFAPSEDEVVIAIQEDDYIYVLGSYYYYSQGEITNMSIDTSVQPEGSYYHAAPCTWTFTCGDVVMNISADVEFYYNGEAWEFDYVYNDTVTAWQSPLSGKWGGTHEGVGKVTIEIPTELNESEDLLATVTVASTENGTYSWIAEIYSYNLDSDSVSMSFQEWVVLPKDNDYYGYKNYSGYIVDKTWTSNSSWDKYTFTKTSSATISDNTAEGDASADA